MAPAKTHVLRIPRTDEEGSFVLVQVTSAGKRDLDVKLVATEGSAAYNVKLRHDKISTHKEKGSPCSQDEWEEFVAAVVLERISIPDIEAVAKVAEEDSITITIRRVVQGIAQRLGTIVLRYSEDEADEIQLFDWCGAAVAAREALRDEMAKSAAKARDLETAVTELKSQLEELIQAKQSDESELLVKFRDLLNEKKVKIREQQQLLASANVDVVQARPAQPVKNEEKEENGTASRGSRKRAAKGSRTSKRKASQAVDDGASGDDLEAMEVDKKHGEEHSEEEQRETTDDDETGSEPEQDDDESMPDAAEGGPAANTRHGGGNDKISEPSDPPPKRSLPFGLGKAASKKATERSDSEDDEL